MFRLALLVIIGAALTVPVRAEQYWYYCDSAHAYYPYVSSCPEPWRDVPARTAISSQVDQSATPKPIHQRRVTERPKRTVATMAPLGAIPAREAALVNTLSRYNQEYDSAPNDIQRNKMRDNFGHKFCAEIPHRPVHNWVGALDSITPTPRPPGVKITIVLPVRFVDTGSLGIGLSIGNSYEYGITRHRTVPIGSLAIKSGTPLYDAIAKMPDNGRANVLFSGRFVPFVNLAACEKAIHYATYFSAMRFDSVRYLGPNR